MSASSTAKVIVVGAGPVGLFTALRLAQTGISVDIFEKDSDLSSAPRAAGYYGGTLVALNKAGMLEKGLNEGYSATGLCWRKPAADDGNGGKRLGDLVARIQFPPTGEDSVLGRTPCLVLPQSRLARLFLSEAEATGLVTIHFNRELKGIQDNEESVTATFLQTDTGKEEVHDAHFLVGADGGKSATRKLLNIPFRGHSWPERLVATDCVLETPQDMDSSCPISFIIHPVHFGIVLPLEPFEPGKRSTYRLAIAVDPQDPRSDDELVSVGSVHELLDKLLPGPRPNNAEVLRTSPYRIHQLCAATFRRGRCLLAGDAAHLNNPFGAMGLSGGLLDAEALADTLDLVVNDGKPLSLLDTYSYERQRVFQIFTNPLSSINKLRCAADPERADEDWLIHTLNTNPSSLKDYARHFHDTWRTDMKKLAETLPSV